MTIRYLSQGLERVERRTHINPEMAISASEITFKVETALYPTGQQIRPSGPLGVSRQCQIIRKLANERRLAESGDERGKVSEKKNMRQIR
jgi:hypothetical protein